MRTHDGFYLRLGLGLGFASGSTKDPSLSESVDFSGMGVISELALGGTVARGLVIGGGVYSGLIPSPTYKALNTETKGGSARGVILGPMIDYYFQPEQGLHVQAAFGIASISAGAGSDTPKYPGQDASGSGTGFMLGLGYETWIGEQWSFGGLVRVLSVSAKIGASDCSSDSCRADTSVLVPGVLATLTYH